MGEVTKDLGDLIGPRCENTVASILIDTPDGDIGSTSNHWIREHTFYNYSKPFIFLVDANGFKNSSEIGTPNYPYFPEIVEALAEKNSKEERLKILKEHWLSQIVHLAYFHVEYS
ncbi:hypothetical protein L596_016852 [Steinernema carpocapsae]|uniref:Uncharacterized protein n=1 Tax=Steinernema carpocapsae TaxID=34508 RepID=A0A4U5NJA5_STECR|nr:hypothetical protein L596_016852 [Steinernema carpocapsae]